MSPTTTPDDAKTDNPNDGPNVSQDDSGDQAGHVPTRLILVRHGESNTTVARRIGGPRTCTGLSDLGRRQAQRLAQRWSSAGDAPAEVHADVLIASHYPRAQETAAIVAPALGGLAVAVDPGWGEHDPGPQIDGLSFAEYAEQHPAAAAAWTSGGADADVFPGGETISVFHARVVDALHRAVSTHAGATVVVSCHGGVVDCVLRTVLGAAATGVFEIHTVNTSITELLHVRPGVWRMVRYNDHAHLAGLPEQTPAAAR